MTAEHFNCWWTHTPTRARAHTHTQGEKELQVAAVRGLSGRVESFTWTSRGMLEHHQEEKMGNYHSQDINTLAECTNILRYDQINILFCVLLGVWCSYGVVSKTVFYCWRFSETVWSFSLTFDSVNRDGRILLHTNPSLFVESRCCCILSPARSSSPSCRGVCMWQLTSRCRHSFIVNLLPELTRSAGFHSPLYLIVLA